MMARSREWKIAAGITITLLFFFSALEAASPRIEYILGMSRPWTHLLQVELKLSDLASNEPTVDITMPVWRTGRYVIYDFAGGVQDVQITDGSGNPLRWEKTDKTTWRVEKSRISTVVVRYNVYANEFDQRTRGLNDRGALVDGASVFMYVEQFRSLPLTLRVEPYADWHVTTGLEAQRGSKTVFVASNYDQLVDCPLFIGTQKDFDFTAGGKPHVLSIMGEGNYNATTMIEDISKIVEANKEFWGDLPYDRYVFMLQLLPQGGGGTEHLNSTIMQTRPFGFNNPGSYQGFLGLVSHEYFHTWNVKQIRPRGISPYDYERENYVPELWIAEGTTSYYGDLTLVRAGFRPAGKYLEGLGGRIEYDLSRPGNRHESVTESGFDAWTKFSKEKENAYNAQTDYYSKGEALSLLLDLEIRSSSQNKHSLDDVMRAMYHRFPRTGHGYTVDDFQKVCEEYAGKSFTDFFTDYVEGTKPLPWETVLRHAGLQLSAKESEGPWVGVSTRGTGDRTIVRLVIEGSPAEKGGLNVGDELLALNGFRVGSNNLSSRIKDFAVGDTVQVTVFRDDQIRKFNICLEQPRSPDYSVERVKEPDPLQKQIYESWLKTTWE